jgi:hypothetical protein
VHHTLGDYLPDAFGPKDLEIKTLLMDEQDHGFALSGDDLSQAPFAPPTRATRRTANPQRRGAAVPRWPYLQRQLCGKRRV